MAGIDGEANRCCHEVRVVVVLVMPIGVVLILFLEFGDLLLVE